MSMGPYQVSAPMKVVSYLCAQKHVTEVRFHVQVEKIPQTWACERCHQKARFIGVYSPHSDERVPDPRRGYVDQSLYGEDDDTDLRFAPESEREKFGSGAFTKEHFEALMSRRSKEELEDLLASRLAKLRESGRL